MIQITHNFDEKKFIRVWAKYVKAGNDLKHGTACIKGPYSRKFSCSSSNDMLYQPVLLMDEQPVGSYKAVYFCGAQKRRIPKTNRPQYVHFAIIPEDKVNDLWEFENWRVEIEGGKLSYISSEEELPESYQEDQNFDEHYSACPIFRWMVGFFGKDPVWRAKSSMQRAYRLNDKTYKPYKSLFGGRSLDEFIQDLLNSGYEPEEAGAEIYNNIMFCVQ